MYSIIILLLCSIWTCDAWGELSSPKFSRSNVVKIDAHLEKADRLFEAGLYDQAIQAYKAIVEEASKNKIADQNIEFNRQCAMQARFNLANVYFALKKYPEAIALLDYNLQLGNGPTIEERLIKQNSIFLKALAYKKMQSYDQAIAAFNSYLNEDGSPSLTLHDEALCEIGICHFLQNRMAESKNNFEQLLHATSHVNLKIVSQFYLARIGLLQGKTKEATAFLKQAASLLKHDDELHFELDYLQGEVAFQSKDYTKAIEYFQKSLTPKKSDWQSDALYQLGWAYLKAGENLAQQNPAQQHNFAKAEECFHKLIQILPSEKGYLALSQCYIIQAKNLNNQDAYLKADALLSEKQHYQTQEGQSQSLLLRAEAAASYELRDQFYRQLTQEENKTTPLFAKGWYMRAMNNFEHALTLTSTDKALAFEQAANQFKKAFDLLKDNDPLRAGNALKFQALSISYGNHPQTNLQTFNILNSLLTAYKDLWQVMENPDEILYLHGFFASKLALENNAEAFANIAIQSLEATYAFPEGSYGDIALKHLGTMYYKQGRYPEAEMTFLKLAEDNSSASCGEAWFWAACCADKLQQDKDISKERRRKAFEHFPHSPYAAEAYFTFYDYQDYLQGDRQAIKHLEQFSKKCPKSPFLIEAYYLIGLDNKRDRKTPEGKWIRKRNLTEAIDAFQEAEGMFEVLKNENLIPSEKKNYYHLVNLHSTLERAKANLVIAEESQGAKKQIYLEYAEDVFKNLVKELRISDFTLHSLYEESTFFLAQTYSKRKKHEEAKKTFHDLIAFYSQAKVSRNLYLSRAWYEVGKIALANEEFAVAAENFKKSEEAGKGNLLTTDQKLDLWIQQSYCYRGLKQFDSSILILSKVVNDDAVSALRLKAMYLRAEIYELQSRPELARKQLESMVKKGGVWAAKAKEKLEQEYGY